MRTYKAEITITDRYNDDNPLSLERIKALIEFEDLQNEGLEITTVDKLEEIKNRD